MEVEDEIHWHPMAGKQVLVYTSQCIVAKLMINLQNLIQTNYLAEIGIAVNTELQLVVCLVCGVALVFGHTAAHIRDNHKASAGVLDNTQLNDIFMSRPLATSLPVFPPTRHTEIEGLKVHSAFQCSHCPKILGVRDGMANHHWSQHKGIALPKSWKTVNAQQMDRGNSKTYFEVEVQEQEPASNVEAEIKTVILQQGDMEAELGGDSDDARLVSPWLQSTHWLQLVDGHDKDNLMASVAMPKGDELSRLVPSVYKMFEDNDFVFEVYPELCSQRLKTADPVNG